MISYARQTSLYPNIVPEIRFIPTGAPEKGLLLLVQQLVVCHVKSTSEPQLYAPIMDYYFLLHGQVYAETPDNFISIPRGNHSQETAVMSCYGRERGSELKSEESDPLNVILAFGM